MKVRADVAALLREGISNAEIARRLDIHPAKVGAVRRALRLPDFRDMKPGLVAGPSHRWHGTRAKYVVESCRCTPCKRANRREENHRTRMHIYGRWQPYVDADPVRAHVATLEAYGLGWKRIARLAGVSTGCMSKLLYGHPQRGLAPSKRVRPETAAKILAVTAAADVLAGHSTIDGTGTRRRLQALCAAGWPQAQLARRLRMTPANFGDTLRGRDVYVSTARAVTQLYEALWRADPREDGVDNQAYSRSRNHARDERWAPVGAWDDDTIDDPAAEPDWTGRCGTPGGYNDHYRFKIPTCARCRAAHSVTGSARRKAA